MFRIFRDRKFLLKLRQESVGLAVRSSQFWSGKPRYGEVTQVVAATSACRQIAEDFTDDGGQFEPVTCTHHKPASPHLTERKLPYTVFRKISRSLFLFAL